MDEKLKLAISRAIALNNSFIADLKKPCGILTIPLASLIDQFEINNALLEAFFFAKLSESIIEDKDKKEE